MIESVTGVIMAGGKSSRMGSNKALLPFQGKPMIQHVHSLVSGIFSRVVVSVASSDAFPNLNYTLIPDRYPEIGPVGGILSVLESGESRIFCAACDMPFLNSNLIRYLCEFQDCDAVIPVWRQKVEVLHAIYSAELISSFQKKVSEGKFRITDSLMEAHVRFINEDEIRQFDARGDSFRNINTPQDYSKLN